ncbi:MAG TPA: C4-dicarboxylate transporter DcuC [Clostridiales bacterium]|jgi:DcuC family C4-dicarboxylate transporter|nr:C4-dicarboxylate transporter DcuC [Clostridiales bacterium]
MLDVLLTLVLVVLLVWGIMKKMNPAFITISLGLITLAGIQIFTGQSVLGDKGTGSLFLDLFENISNTAGSQLGRNVLLVMTVMGYVYICDKLNASKMFAVYAAKPFKKAKSPYVIVVFVIVLGAFLKLAITSSSSLCTMLIATMYPVMRAAGVSRGTAATAVTLPGCIIWGPSDANIFLAFELAGIKDYSVVDFFIHYQIPLVIIILIVFAVTVPLFSKMWDKRDKAKGIVSDEGDIQVLTAESLGVPKFYAIFPLLPLVIILIFSGLFPSTPNITVGAAHWLCLFILIIVDIIVKRRFVEGFNNSSEFFRGMGNYLAMGGMIMVGASLFSAALTGVGGMANIGKALTSGNAGYALTIILAVILGYIIAAFSHVSPALNIFIPLFVAVSAMTGQNIIHMVLALLTGACMGIAILPTNSALVIASGSLGISIPDIMKRNFLPSACAMIAVIITCLVMSAVGY